MSKMKNIFNKINKNYYADGEDPTNRGNSAYVDIYNNAGEIIELFGSVEQCESLDLINRDSIKSTIVTYLKFPMITFEKESTLGGYLFEADTTEDYIMAEADSYFIKRN